MYLKSLLLRLAPLMLGCALSQPVLAQIVPPAPIELGATEGRLDANTARRSSNHAFACYALETKPGEEVSIHLKSSAFDPVLEVARGALCNAAALQYENDNTSETTKDARISFRAAGGRYLILVRGVSPSSQGAYQLKLDSGLQAVAKNQPGVSDEAQRRRQIMEMEIQKRNAAIAAAEAKRQAELAAAQAQRAAWLAQERERQLYEDYDDYEDDYESPPTRNPMAVFADTLLNELNTHHQQQQAIQRNIDEAARRGEAQYQRRLAAERAQQAQQQQNQAARQAAAQAAERARVAAEASRRLALAGSAQRTNDRIVAHPAGGQSTINSSSGANRASTRNDPATCVAGPELVKNPNCPNGAGSRVTNQCAHAIDARICHWTTQERWDCGITTVSPGSTGGYPSCFGTGRLWMRVRYSDAKTRFADPP